MEEFNYKTVNLGCHASVASFKELKEYTDIFQICLHSPVQFILDEEVILAKAVDARKANPEGTLVYHTPYWINIQQNNKFTKMCLRNLHCHMRAAIDTGVKYVVTHTGTRNVKDKGQISVEESVATFKSLLRSVLMKYVGEKTKLLIENVSLPRENGKGYSMEVMIDVINEFRKDGITNLGLCFDLEHAYAAGVDDHTFEACMNFADVLHFNPIPDIVEFGRGLDRHSETNLSESVGIPPSKYLTWLRNFKEKIKILEMEESVAIETFKWLTRQVNEWVREEKN